MSSTPAVAMADIASQFLSTLNPEQRELAQWSFPSDEERRMWFYTPTDHGGLTLHTLAPEQTRLVMRFIDAGLSRSAYVTTSTIMGLENVLDQLEGWGAHWDFPRGRDPQRYFLRIFGDPTSDTWAWRLGGHHISLNFTISNGEVVSATPCFLGADPAASPLLGGQLLRPLGACEDLSRELLSSFSNEQKVLAIVSSVPPTDLVTANRPHLTDGDRALPLARVWRNEFTGELLDVVERFQSLEEKKIGYTDAVSESLAYTSTPKGIAAAHMTDAQQQILSALLDTYIGRISESIADAEFDKVRENFHRVHFAWAGGTEPGQPHYYRIQGPRILAEYDNTTRDGNHVHTVWRDPVNDFGSDVLSQHHRHSH